MWPYPEIVAHRGGGALAPENTIAALRCGLAYGFHAVEFDVMLAGDGIPVVLHDEMLGRTVAGNGKVPDFTAADLMRMDAGAWFSPAFAGETVPSYAQVFHFCLAHGIWMNVEIKPAPGFETATGRTVAALTAQWLADAAAGVAAGVAGASGRPDAAALASGWPAPLLSSFSHDALLAAQAAAPGLARACLFDVVPDDWRQRLAEVGAVALHTNHEKLTPQLAAAVKAAGYGLFCYTVNEPARAREIRVWGVDAFCTDRIDLIGADFR
ncbi:glycerophosphodiester phosphodiesterase family protein [Noviherbaspirillum sedimenti]|uniref:Glycerophosphodiester phosphodiesterase n=1 Tax=Noviherbaspirillum sedimenti TaxID=2320865 RepID=A0A3A3GQH5_9BURK|nr:glycerophosphodiester phosphodiesterase family protein [Noviherbaspirillum sedimenti]RJG04606.1 glycerophosphodiester phosphodiesterase [Noviherbaspirillum sedimenti]